MKLSELKLGDWVYAKNPITCEDMPCKVESLADCKILAGKIWFKLDELTPIPLTEEIFEKNGWRENDEIWGIDNAFGQLHIEFFSNGKEIEAMVSVTDGRDVCCLKQIKHIHELQHILWALGIKDNLKV